MGQFHIAVVDDDLDYVETIVEMISSEISSEVLDVVFHVATDGEEALDMLLERRFGAIVLDHYMPKVKGSDVLQLLRDSNHPNNETPVLLVSAYIDDSMAKLSNDSYENVFLFCKSEIQNRICRQIRMVSRVPARAKNVKVKNS